MDQFSASGGFGSGGRELLGRHLGMFKDKLDIGVDDSLAAVLKAIDGKTRGLYPTSN